VKIPNESGNSEVQVAGLRPDVEAKTKRRRDLVLDQDVGDPVTRNEGEARAAGAVEAGVAALFAVNAVTATTAAKQARRVRWARYGVTESF
jgi:hypothetical protein